MLLQNLQDGKRGDSTFSDKCKFIHQYETNLVHCSAPRRPHAHCEKSTVNPPPSRIAVSHLIIHVHYEKCSVNPPSTHTMKSALSILPPTHTMKSALSILPPTHAHYQKFTVNPPCITYFVFKYIKAHTTGNFVI